MFSLPNIALVDRLQGILKHPNSGWLTCTIGEGDGTPLQYSCLENPMDGGPWWAAVHGVTKSRMWLSDFTFTFHFHALEKEMATHSSVLAWRILGMGEPGGLLSMGSPRVWHNWSDFAAAATCIILWKHTTLGRDAVLDASCVCHLCVCSGCTSCACSLPLENKFSLSLHQQSSAGIDFICGDWLKDGAATQTKPRIQSCHVYCSFENGLPCFPPGFELCGQENEANVSRHATNGWSLSDKRTNQVEGKWSPRVDFWHGLTLWNKTHQWASKFLLGFS